MGGPLQCDNPRVDELEILFSGAQIGQKVAELAARIDHDFPERADAPPLWLIGALKGAFVLTADLARAMRRECRVDFVEAKSYGQGTEPSGELRILREPEVDLAGCDVLLVEDILDTGRTAERLLALLASKRLRTLRLVALLDKPSRRKADVQADYVGFEIPDCFVVGYGMDYAERWRDLPDIRAMRKVPPAIDR